METTVETQHPKFLDGGGEMGRIMRSHDWASTPLGTPDQWPQTLRSALSICLNSGFPIGIYWGSDFLLLYNDAWSTIPGDKHPWSLGRPGKMVWPEIWHQVEAEFESVMKEGNSIRSKDTLLLMQRFGYKEECYFDYTLSPIFDSEGNVAGVFNAAIETTYRVVMERRSRLLHDLEVAINNNVRSRSEGRSKIAQVLEKYQEDIPFCIFYSINEDRIELSQAIHIPSFTLSSPWPIAGMLENEQAVYIEDITKYISAPILSKWNEPCTEALLLPLKHSQGSIDGFIVAGINPRKKLDSDYHKFLESVAVDIGTAVTNGANFEEEQAIYNQLLESENNLKKVIEEQKKLVTLVENSLEVMSILELDGKNSYLNKAGMQLLGFDSVEQVLNTPISDLHTAEDIQFVEANVLPSVLQTGKWSGTMNVRHMQTGEVFPVHNNTVRIDDPVTGLPMAIGAVMRDIRPDLLVQKALLDGERNFRNMIMQAPVAMCILIGSEFRVEVANERMLEVWGKTAEQMINKPLFLELREARQEGYEELLTRVYTTGETFSANGVSVSLPRNGIIETVYVNLVYEAFRGAEGEISGIMVVASDVTEQVLATKKIANSEARFRLLADSMAQFVWTGDASGNLHYFNQAVYNYTGLSEEQVLSDGWLQIVHPDDREENISKWIRSIQTGEDFILHHRFKKYSGEYRWQLSRAIPQRDSEGNIQMWVGTSTDIHDQKLFEEELQRRVNERTAELEKKNSELEQFAHVSSHDLQEPLRKIVIFAEKIKFDTTNNVSESSQKYFDKIMEAARRMSTSLNDLLNYTSLSKEEQIIEVDLNNILNAVQGDLEHVISQKNASIKIDKLPVVHAVKPQMQMLFYNLVNNALKFAKKDVPPIIEISVDSIKGKDILQSNKLDPNKEYYDIAVTDNGIGFEQNFSEKIFTMFQRLHSRDKYSGTGIGLSLCRKVALNHNGEVFAISKPDEGATFHVILPVSL